MKLSMSTRNAIKDFSRFHDLYWRPSWYGDRSLWQKAESDWREALQLSRTYWFERKAGEVVRAKYSEAAKRVYEKLASPPSWAGTRYVARAHKRWRKECESIGIGINSRLYHSGDPATSLLTIARDAPSGNILRWGITQISSGKTREAAERLVDALPGVRLKISRFWLRDVAHAFNLPIGEGDEQYLQPIDSWVYQFLRELGSVSGILLPEEMGASRRAYDTAVEYMIELARAADVRPSALNCAAWCASQVLNEWGTQDTEEWSAASLITKPKRLTRFVEQTIPYWISKGSECLGVLSVRNASGEGRKPPATSSTFENRHAVV